MIRPVPCFHCGSRASCRHREVEDVQLPKRGRPPSTADLEPVDGRQHRGAMNRANQLWGAKRG